MRLATRATRPEVRRLLPPLCRLATQGCGGNRATGRFKVYYAEKCPESSAALAVFEASDAPYTAINFLAKKPKLEVLRDIAYAVEGGAEVLLIDNSWPRVVNPDEVAEVCSSNPSLMQRPVVVAPDGSTVCRPITASEKDLAQVSAINLLACLTQAEPSVVRLAVDFSAGLHAGAAGCRGR